MRDIVEVLKLIEDDLKNYSDLGLDISGLVILSNSIELLGKSNLETKYGLFKVYYDSLLSEGTVMVVEDVAV